MAPEEGQALQKHRTFFPLGSLGKLSARWRVSLWLFIACQWEQPRRRRGHMAWPAAGTGRSTRPMAGRGGGLPDPLPRRPLEGGPKSCRDVFCSSLYKGLKSRIQIQQSPPVSSVRSVMLSVFIGILFFNPFFLNNNPLTPHITSSLQL